MEILLECSRNRCYLDYSCDKDREATAMCFIVRGGERLILIVPPLMLAPMKRTKEEPHAQCFGVLAKAVNDRQMDCSL